MTSMIPITKALCKFMCKVQCRHTTHRLLPAIFDLIWTVHVDGILSITGIQVVATGRGTVISRSGWNYIIQNGARNSG
jgi:hypothetical protein